jgi:hypothetical protein
MKLDAANVAVTPLNQLPSSGDTTNLSTLQEFAAFTGGKIYAGGDIERDLPTALETGQNGYRIQYAPAADSWDGKLHKIHTSVRKGITLQIKQSYLAEKPGPAVADKDRALALFQQPFDNTNIALRVTATEGAQPRALHLSLSIDAQDLVLGRQDDKTLAELTLYFAAYLPGDHIQTYDPIPVHLSLAAPQLETVMRNGLRLGNDLTVPEAATKLRIVLVDRAGAAASVTLPLN